MKKLILSFVKVIKRSKKEVKFTPKKTSKLQSKKNQKISNEYLTELMQNKDIRLKLYKANKVIIKKSKQKKLINRLSIDDLKEIQGNADIRKNQKEMVVDIYHNRSKIKRVKSVKIKKYK
ncbi:hypothetical protein TUBRATIS_28440 [Tubulinosema ratisbonensis]|uniref:Uncharacterized protein n=1 Tax=Tubulinosema ratisbonensis TaxID=291195 RepID=A0A437AI17_9MICR|nr:hypothetical protein TUBRATIS_28440 [Tubulinosema ratisbonensis]